MGQDVTKTMANLATLIKDLGKTPVPPFVQKDFTAFTQSVTGMRDFLSKAEDSTSVAKARADFAKDKPDFDKKKKSLSDNKDLVNNAQPGQAASLSNGIGRLGDMNKAAKKVIDLLEGKPGPEAVLYKALSSTAGKIFVEVYKTDKPALITAVL